MVLWLAFLLSIIVTNGFVYVQEEVTSYRSPSVTECESDLATDMHNYAVKIMNPDRKSDYVFRKFQSMGRFVSVKDLKSKVLDKLSSSINLQPGEEDNLEVGFIAAGHGLKGKQCWIVDADDIELMYKEYGKKEICLWCIPRTTGRKSGGKKRTRSPSPSSVSQKAKYQSHGKMIEEVDDILKKLEEKHAGKYDDTRLRAWAHMVHLGTHKSLDDPPDKPFFKTGKKAPNSPRATTSTRITVTTGNSLSKRLNYRSQCIDQLQSWHELLERGAIDQNQYDDLAQTILKDMHA